MKFLILYKRGRNVAYSLEYFKPLVISYENNSICVTILDLITNECINDECIHCGFSGYSCVEDVKRYVNNVNVISYDK